MQRHPSFRSIFLLATLVTPACAAATPAMESEASGAASTGSGGTSGCDGGQCEADCVDECTDGEVRCSVCPSVQRCGQGDSDPCLEWLAAEPSTGTEGGWDEAWTATSTVGAPTTHSGY